MTLIVTLFSPLGMVQASDSVLTYSNGQNAGSAPKLFEVPGHSAVLAFSGCYAVGGEALDTWMPRALSECDEGITVAETAAKLRDRLQAEVLPDEARAGYLIHLAGYEPGEVPHPVMWFIRNFHAILPDGGYADPEAEFLLSEDLWDRDRRNSPTADLQFYANGTPQGRITFMAVTQTLMAFLRSVWHQPTWEFHPPRSADQLGALAQFLVRAITLLFEMSGYGGPPIGGEVQLRTIPPPAGAIWTPPSP